MLGHMTRLLYMPSHAVILETFLVPAALSQAPRHGNLWAEPSSVRRNRQPPLLLVHAAISIPTMAIDVQIRLAFAQLVVGQLVIATTVSIVVCEVLVRTAKILRLRYRVSSRIDRSTGMHRILQRVHSKIAVRDVAMARAEYAQFLDWKRHVVRLHAAEVYADMHGEYVSIGCAMAVLFFLHGHPAYTFPSHSMVHFSQPITSEQLVSVLAQIVLGLLVDYVLSVVEIIHEVPLYETSHSDDPRLRSFLRLLLPALAATTSPPLPSSTWKEADGAQS